MRAWFQKELPSSRLNNTPPIGAPNAAGPGNEDVNSANCLLPNHEHSGRGTKLTVDTLRKDTELDCVNEIGGLMNNRCLWRTAIDTQTPQPP